MQEITDPKTELLVTGITNGASLLVTGYYHYDREVDKHYICCKVSLYRYEVNPKTIKFPSNNTTKTTT